MKKTPQSIVTEFLTQIGRKGGLSRGKKHSKAQLSKWAKLGGRPRKDGKKRKPK